MVDLVLNALVNTMQPSISIRRVLEKNNVDCSDDSIASIEAILKSKSLAEPIELDSKGHASYSLTVTGQDFLRSFGSYSKFLRGIESENKRVERARKKKPYTAYKSGDGKPPLPYVPKEESFWKSNRLGIIILAVVLTLFYIVSRITESLG